MSSSIPTELRQFVGERANFCCEYCLVPQFATLHKHEPDHIIPRQHGGETESDNLALSCMRCNRYKGPNIGSFDPQSGDLVPFYNPRSQIWQEHFTLEYGLIHPLTPEARVTIKILHMNSSERVVERQRLQEVGFYPPNSL